MGKRKYILSIILFMFVLTLSLIFWKSWGHSPSHIYQKVVMRVMNHIPASFWEQVWFKGIHKDTSSRLVWGYVNKHSVRSNDTFSMMLSTDSIDPVVKGRIEIYRIGSYEKSDRKLFYTSGQITVIRHPVPPAASAVGLNWPVALRVKVNNQWKSGYYTMNFVGINGIVNQDIAYIVVTPAIKSGDVLIKLSTNTYEAYNLWGGADLYRSSYNGLKGELYKKEIKTVKNNVVSFDRPTESQFFRWEYYYVIWIEKLAKEKGFSVHYATDFDVSESVEYTRNYKLFVTLGHDEYWTMKEFKNVYNRIFNLGKNTLFLGANEAYWQVRFSDLSRLDDMKKQGRLMVCYKGDIDPVRSYFPEGENIPVTNLFRAHSRYPETMMLGVGYQDWFPPDPNIKYPYYANMDQNDFFLFKNTGFKQRKPVADVAGYEWDNTDPEGDGARLWSKKTSKINLLPANKLKVLFYGEPLNSEGVKGRAESVYFQSEAGAKVFSAGSIRWAWGVGKDGFKQNSFIQFNRNLVLNFLGLKLDANK